MKNSASPFCAPDAPECTTRPADPTECKNTSLAQRVPVHFLSNPYWSHLSMKIVCCCFMPRMHQNALCDPQIPLDAKTQVWQNVSRCAFYENHTGPTHSSKIVHQCFAPRTQWNGLRDPHIPPDAKTQVLRNMSQRAFKETASRTPKF
jgi:hypothetical protein